MSSERPIELPSERPVHPTAKLIKDKYEEYYNYRLPDGCPTWEPDHDDNGKIKRFSSPRIIYTASFINYEGIVSFSEWVLYFLPNQPDLWYQYYY